MNLFRIQFLRAFLILIATFSFLACHKGSPLASIPRDLDTGDLVFIDLDCGEICDAIEIVTLEQQEASGPRLSHVGIIWKEKGKFHVLEAWPEGGVRKVSLESFLERASSADNVFYGVFNRDFESHAKRAAEWAKRQVGKPYDFVFKLGGDEYYCSELVRAAYKDILGNYLFKVEPMYFGENDSEAYKVWKGYFDQYKTEIPTDEDGISPLSIYLQGRYRFFN